MNSSIPISADNGSRWVVLVRHGHIRGDGERRYIGHTDLPLSHTGRSQARLIDRWLSSFSIQRIAASDLKRSADTAEIVAMPRKRPVERLYDLREIHLGEWENRTFSEIRSNHPDQFRLRGETLPGYRPPGGESFMDLQKRVMPVFDRLVTETEGNLLIVGHGGVNRVILCRLLGMPLMNLFRMGQDYGGVNLIQHQDQRHIVKAVNVIPE